MVYKFLNLSFFNVCLFSSTSVELLALPTVGTRNLVKHLNQDEEERKHNSVIILSLFNLSKK